MFYFLNNYIRNFFNFSYRNFICEIIIFLVQKHQTVTRTKIISNYDLIYFLHRWVILTEPQKNYSPAVM